MIITSLQNARVKNVVKLREARARAEQGLTIVEGYRAILRALDNAYPLSEIYVCPALFLGENEDALIERAIAAGARAIQVAEDPFVKMAYRDRPEGLLALAPQLRTSLQEYLPDDKGFYLIVEAIERPGNLGSILRSADAAGVDAVVVCEPQTDILNPEVIRASVGTLFALTILEATTSQAIAWCRRHTVRSMAATPHAERLYTQVDMRGALAIVMGTEQHGLSEVWLSLADVQMRIPMFGQADSLNVATASTLLLYEVVRQRRLAGSQVG
jgi:TrmH family RNA methyltransferase